jgi:acyl carrier protein
MSATDERLQGILDDVAVDIRAVLGEEWAAEVDIAMETSFADELEIESVEMVALSERLQSKFGDSIDLAAWLADKEMDELIELKVRDLVEYLAARLTG